MSASNGPNAFRKFVKNNNLQFFKKLEYEVRIAVKYCYFINNIKII